MEVKNNYGKKMYLFFFSIFIVYLYLAINTPLTHDDWTWGSRVGLDRLKSWYDNYNGRYLGNSLEVLITRMDLVRYFLVAVFSTVIIIFIAKRLNSYFAMLLGFLLILSMPINIYSQTYGWAAGFANYIPSIALILLYIYIIDNIFSEDVPNYSRWKAVFVIPLGFATQLFVEHVTIYAVIMALSVIIFTYYKFRRFYGLHIAYLISTIVGALTMFTNSVYLNIVTGNDSYRTIETSGEDTGMLKRFFDVYTEEMYPFLFMNNTVLNIILSVFCVIIIMGNSNLRYRFKKIIENILLVIFVIYPLYKPLLKDSFQIDIFGKYTNEFEAFISVCFYLSIFAAILLYTDQKNIKYRVGFYLLSVACLAAPLFFVQPFGPRNFLATYVFFALLATEIGGYISKKYFNMNSLNKLMLIPIMAIIICYGYVLTINNKVDNERIDYIHQQLERNEVEIVLTRLPYEKVLWASTPHPQGNHTPFFKMFYNIPDDVELKVIPYNEWVKLNK